MDQLFYVIPRSTHQDTEFEVFNNYILTYVSMCSRKVGLHEDGVERVTHKMTFL